MDLRDRRLRHLLEQVPDGEDLPPVRAHRLGLLGKPAEVRQVHARGEHRAVAAQHQDPDGIVPRRLPEGLPEVANELSAQGVPLLRPRHYDVANSAAVFDLDEWHVVSPRSNALTTTGEGG